jgi:hypothetical protein
MVVVMVVVSAMLLAATWVVYPMWLRVRASYHPPFMPSGRHARWPSVTIVVVVRDGAEALRHLLNNLLALAYPADLRRILVVSVASTDGTDAVARLFIGRGVELLRIMRLSAGVENIVRRYVDSEVVVRVHPLARLRPSALAALVAPFADRSVGVAYAREITPKLTDVNARTAETMYRRFEGRLRERETRVFGTASAHGSLYAVRGPLYRAPVPGGLSPDLAEALTAREHGYRAVYVPDAACIIARDRSPREDYMNTMHAVKREVVTLFAMRHLLNPRRYGAFAWILLGHKLGRWLSPWALLGVAAGLLLLAPAQPLARGALGALGVMTLLAVAAWLTPGRSWVGRIAAMPGRVAATAVAFAHGFVSALWITPDLTLTSAGRPIRSVRLRF